MTTRTSLSSERGTALLIVLLMLTLAVGLLGGFVTTLATDQQLRGVDQARTRVFYAAHGALEQLTTDLGNLFVSNFAPTVADVNNLTAVEPVFNRVVLEDPLGGTGYEIDFPQLNGVPVTDNRAILSGPFQGFTGLVTPYRLAVTARSAEDTSLSSEVRLERTLQTVAIPLFQFGIFSETDLSYFPGPNFNFGGRVHTNRHLFLAVGDGSSLNIRDRVTAVGEVVRTHLSNGWSNTSNYNGTVNVANAPNSVWPLAMNEGSLVNTIGSAQREPGWTNTSIGTYNGYLRNGRTGARRLDLPFTTLGATPIDLIRRGTTADHPLVLAQRYYQLASMRILLSNTAADLTGLPGVVGTPLSLEAGAPNYDGTLPVALSAGGGNDRTQNGRSRLGGWILIEIQRADQTWLDVTNEVLGLGITGASPTCASPNANAILRIQRLADGAACNNTNANNFWPNTLYDAREGNIRDTNDSQIRLAGVMHYIELDVNNLRRWFLGQIGANGVNARSVNGYTVYFSDRRTNRNAGVETGELGFDDFVHANGTLDTGEDVNGNNTWDSYGNTADLTNAINWVGTPTLATQVTAAVAQRNRAVFFRRALKVTNGALGNLPAPGFTLVAENPVYVQGHYNAVFAGCNVNDTADPPAACHDDVNNSAAAVIADAVTLLSQSWTDKISYDWPTRSRETTTNPQQPRRPATTTWYRMAILSGKGLSFPQPSGTARDFGTDGGVHNFLRYLEDWTGQRLNYRGSIASLYFNRQAVGTYKCCETVYNPPTRGYNFDVEFLQPALLPPFTPMFRDVNTTGFTQVIR